MTTTRAVEAVIFYAESVQMVTRRDSADAQEKTFNRESASISLGVAYVFNNRLTYRMPKPVLTR